MTTYIIGNGFDIAHGLDTSFESFRNYLDEKNSNLLYRTPIGFDQPIYVTYDISSVSSNDIINMNIYLIIDENKCFIVDPGGNYDEIDLGLC